MIYPTLLVTIGTSLVVMISQSHCGSLWLRICDSIHWTIAILAIVNHWSWQRMYHQFQSGYQPFVPPTILFLCFYMWYHLIITNHIQAYPGISKHIQPYPSVSKRIQPYPSIISRISYCSPRYSDGYGHDQRQGASGCHGAAPWSGCTRGINGWLSIVVRNDHDHYHDNNGH